MKFLTFFIIGVEFLFCSSLVAQAPSKVNLPPILYCFGEGLRMDIVTARESDYFLSYVLISEGTKSPDVSFNTRDWFSTIAIEQEGKYKIGLDAKYGNLLLEKDLRSGWLELAQDSSQGTRAIYTSGTKLCCQSASERRCF